MMSARFYVISKRFEMEINEKEMTTDFANTDNPGVQNKLGRAQGNIWATDMIFSSIGRFAGNILGIFTYSAIIVTMSPIILVVIAVSSVINYFMGKNQIKYADKHKDITSERWRKQWHITGYAREFEYAKEVKLYGMTGWINDMLGKFKFESLKWEKNLSFRSFMINTVNALLTLIRDGAAYIILIYMLLDNKITLGDFAFYFGAVAGFARWLDGIANSFNSIIQQSLAVGYCREYLDIQDVYNHGTGCELPKKEDLPLEIEFRNVSYKYQGAENYTLKNIDLKINKGEKLAIVGENGAGKTTLVKLLCGYYYPTEGEIYINGKSLPEYNLEEYYTMFAAVFQDIGLLPITIEEFVSSRNAESGDIDGDKVKRVIEQAELGDKVAALSSGVKTKLMKSVYDDAIDLSGGEKQKLMLARALYKNAPCIILDEPTAALDPIAESNLYNKYNELTQDKTSVYISHRLASTRFCDRIVYIEKGGIAEQGTHNELIKSSGRYANMFDLQSHYYKENIENAENVKSGEDGQKQNG
jgi:ABC-type multidrug transport system fused ATPase/permease subunit